MLMLMLVLRPFGRVILVITWIGGACLPLWFGLQNLCSMHTR